MSMKTKFIEIEFPNVGGIKNLPKWQRLIFVEEDNEVIYVPAVLVLAFEPLNLPEIIIASMICDDGYQVIVEKGHIYAPLDWFCSVYPNKKEKFFDIYEKNIRIHLERLKEKKEVQ